MSNNYLQEIISNHRSKGMIEEGNCVTIIDDNLVKYNKYNLRVFRIKESKIDTNYYNSKILSEVKKDSSLYKEIREFNLLLRFFNKLKIKKGYVRKTESPDFEFTKNGLTYGIEVTRLYTGNDWVAEKMHNEIVAYKLTGKHFKEYMNNNRYASRVKAYENNNDIVIKAIKEEHFAEDEIIQIKNKLFEKIRKQLDDYQKFDVNMIFAEIVYTGYKSISSYNDLNDEINYFVSHLDVNFDKTEFHLILKNGNVYADFDLKNKSYVLL